MEIQENEYVRTKNGIIAKLEEIITEEDSTTIYCFDKTIYTIYAEPIEILSEKQLEEYILKHSFNIIDLIEIKDLIEVFVEENIDENGTTENTCVYEVTAIQVKDFYGNKTNEIVVSGNEGLELIPFANVRSIVTKEQFESIKYEV